jgi:hypothetical protein
MTFQGATSISLDAQGDLILKTAGSQLEEQDPTLYQPNGSGDQTPVLGSFVIEGDGAVGFSMGRYDPVKELVIDPQLVYSSYVNGSSAESAYSGDYGIAIAPNGDVVVVGYATSLNNLKMATVTCLSPDGQLIYNTLFGGNVANNFGVKAGQNASAVAVGNSGTVYVVGTTDTNNFPVTYNAYQSTFSGSTLYDNAFLTTFDENGEIVYST